MSDLLTSKERASLVAALEQAAFNLAIDEYHRLAEACRRAAALLTVETTPVQSAATAAAVIRTFERALVKIDTYTPSSTVQPVQIARDALRDAYGPNYRSAVKTEAPRIPCAPDDHFYAAQAGSEDRNQRLREMRREGGRAMSWQQSLIVACVLAAVFLLAVVPAFTRRRRNKRTGLPAPRPDDRDSIQQFRRIIN